MQRMRQHSTAAALALIGLAVTFSGCGGGGEVSQSPTPQPSGNPTPVLGSLSPTSVVVGGSGFTLTLNGSNFAVSTAVQWNQETVPTTFVSSQQLTVAISPTLVASAGNASVRVLNPSSGESNALEFNIDNPAPQITSILPDHAMAGAAPLVLTVNCTNFVIFSGPNFNVLEAKLLVNGSPRTINSFTATQLVTTLSASDLAAAGTISVTVANPDPAAPSNQVAFTVTPTTSNPAPTLASASDASVPVGWPGFPLTVYGTNFVGTTVLRWGGVDRQTTVVSSTELNAAIPASDLASPGATQVSVSNPPPGGGASDSLTIQIQAVPPDAIGVIDRSDIGTDLTQPNGDNVFAAVSADGRYVVFQSDVANPSANQSGLPTLLLRDTCIGAPDGCVPSLTLVPGSPTAPAQSNDAPYKPAISANGRFIGFSSWTDFVLYDTCLSAPAGCVPAARTVSSTDDPTGFVTISEVSLSADGRFAVTMSGALGCSWANDCDDQGYAFLTDTCAGASSDCTPSYLPLLPDGEAPVAAGGEIYRPSISPDGRFVAFNWSTSNPYNWTDALENIWLFDSCQGAPAGCSRSQTMVTVAMDGSSADAYSYGATLSTGGRYVAFVSFASNLVPGIPDTSVLRLYLRDMCIGAPDGCVPATTLISVVGDGTVADTPSISADGRYIAFTSWATDLVAGDTNGAADVFVRDTCIGVSSGCTPSTVRVSVALDGTQGNGDSGSPEISADGRFVVFISAAKLGPGANGLGPAVYVARH